MVQGDFRNEIRAAGIQKRDIFVHTLRHSCASHLRVIQDYLGHPLLGLLCRGWSIFPKTILMKKGIKSIH